ncbi:hypothetical protein HPP92_007108 [Vanilla planifolia]|uniref:DUF4378 domain-containing protein n=1 Tax=Vanilla planifolia TaxID=51239 RepID=A0A835RLQ7_VANPL|nr:hypothetical protein HPP92_007108 [Vanilla planifolia]
MGGKSHISSLNEINSAKYLMANKRLYDGVEAPRNSLDLPQETSIQQLASNESFMAKQSSSKMNFIGSKAPVKVLISEETSNTETIKHSGPSVIARLMGVDGLPPEIEQTIHVKEYLDDSPRKYMSRVQHFESNKTELTSLSSTSFNKLKEESPLNYAKQYSSPSAKYMTSVTPSRREHPQEELLQKFKREFEAWQASKVWECSRNLDLSDNHQIQKNEQIVVQENLGMGKMARYTNSNGYMFQKKPTGKEVYCPANKIRICPNRTDGGNFDKQCLPRRRENTAIRKKQVSYDLQTASSANFQEKRFRCCSPKKIVILKPSSDNYDIDEPWGGTSVALEKSRSMEDFLEEVKERLRLEIEGKGRNDSIRGIATHTTLHERSANPKQLARDIAKHIRESITRECETTMLRSESTRTYRNDFDLNESPSPESIRRVTRKFMSDRLKSILKDDTNMEEFVLHCGRTRKPLLIKEKESSGLMNDFSKFGEGARFWEDKKAVEEPISKYQRCEQVKKVIYNAGTVSPPNLIRSFSAPASGNVFQKLLLEDHGVVNSTQVPQKNEASKGDSVLVARNRKDRFNLKGRVWNLRRNFSFSSHFFRKKISSMGESAAIDTFYYEKPIEAAVPLENGNFSLVQDNSTEVPPSPASFCNSPINEHHSPVSPLEIPFVEDNSSVPVSGELRMDLLGTGSCTKQVECKESEVEETEAQSYYNGDETKPARGSAKAYVRDILVVLGFCKDSTLDQALLSLDGQTKPIPPWVFREVENNYCKHGKEEHDYCKLDDMTINRRMLFDLINEALPCVLGGPRIFSMRKRWIQEMIELPRGRKLLDMLLHQIQMHANPMADEHQSVDRVVAWDVKLWLFSTASLEDVSSVGKEVEHVIIGELIDDLVSDLMDK